MTELATPEILPREALQSYRFETNSPEPSLQITVADMNMNMMLYDAYRLVFNGYTNQPIDAVVAKFGLGRIARDIVRLQPGVELQRSIGEADRQEREAQNVLQFKQLMLENSPYLQTSSRWEKLTQFLQPKPEDATSSKQEVAAAKAQVYQKQREIMALVVEELKALYPKAAANMTNHKITVNDSFLINVYQRRLEDEVHQMRSPITVLFGYTQLYLDELRKRPINRGGFVTIGNGLQAMISTRLSDIIKQFPEIEEAIKDPFYYPKETVNIKNLQEAHNQFLKAKLSGQFRDMNIQFQVSSSAQGVNFIASHKYLRTVFSELSENFIRQRYLVDGQNQQINPISQVLVYVDVVGGYLRIQVKDNGRGFPVEWLDPQTGRGRFERHRTGVAQIGGTGVGGYAMTETVEKVLHGQVYYSNKPIEVPTDMATKLNTQNLGNGALQVFLLPLGV